MMEKDRILLVDDEELIVLTMRKYFEGLGYRVDAAHELEEAQALLANRQYDLVICDLRLTGIGGVEGLQIVADIHQRCANTRVVLLSAFGTPEIERESYNRGADAFLHKPKSMMEIASVAMNLLEQRLSPRARSIASCSPAESRPSISRSCARTTATYGCTASSASPAGRRDRTSSRRTCCSSTCGSSAKSRSSTAPASPRPCAARACCRRVCASA